MRGLLYSSEPIEDVRYTQPAQAPSRYPFNGLQSMVNDLSLFKIGRSKVHGNGLLAARAIKRGELAGLQWYEYQPPRRVIPTTDLMMAFYPEECMFLPGEAPGKPSVVPTQHLPPADMVGCFPRAVNHECYSSCELHIQEAPSKVCPRDHQPDTDAERNCVPEAIASMPRKVGSKLYAVYLRALRDLKEGDEITYNYLTAPDYVWKEPHVVAGCT